MRRSIPLLLVALMLMQTLVYIAAPAEAAVSGRSGANDDFSVRTITVSNASAINQWIQPDGSVMEYIAEGDEVYIDVEVKRGGNAFSGLAAEVKVEIVHPIGYIMNSTTWNTTSLIGGQSYTDSFTWTALVSHSILDVDTNELSGGIIIRASVMNAQDDRNENDVMDRELPVAISQDNMEAEGDPRDTSTSPQLGVPTFFGGEYPAEGGEATGYGIWQKDNSGAVNGAAHWRHSNGGDYPSASHSRLIYAFSLGQSSNQCGQNAVLDGKLSEAYWQFMCKVQLNSAAYVSVQMHAQAWGVMGAGDNVGFEMWRGNGAPASTIAHNFTQHSPGSTAGAWTNISWDPTDVLGGHSWSYGMLFHSDSSGASGGMHIDDFVMFGIKKVPEYTLNISCDDPVGGYTAAPNSIIAMHCSVTNNGYMPAMSRITSNVTNDTWMNPSLPMIRIDSDHPSQHGVSVILPAIPGGNTTEIWINLSVPAGADVQQQSWSVWWEDVAGTNLGELGRITSDVAITEQYGVHLSSSAPLIADSMVPGDTSDVPFRLQNSGNKAAGFTVTSNFQEDGWVAFVTDLNGSIVQMPIPLSKGEDIELLLNITAPDDSTPGEIPFTLRAVCPTCGSALFGNDVISKKILVPVLRDFELAAETYQISGPANGIAQRVYVDLFNLGNADEQFSLSMVQSNWKLEAYLSTTETAILDAWDGETSIILNLPMPVGLNPGLYTARIDASSVDDPSVVKQITISIEITDTAAVYVSDEIAEQSYIPGDAAQSMRFEVRNDGNMPDRFMMSMDVPEGMNAIFEHIIDNRTPLLEPGSSHNVTVTFSFDEGSDGQLSLKVIATSVNDGNISSHGSCTYFVGSQNWLRIISTERPVFTEGGEYLVSVRVRNQYTEGQSVSMSMEQHESNRWFSGSIASSDRDFWLDVEEERTITVVFDVQESTLLNLEDTQVDTFVTLWARSNTVTDAASLDMDISLYKVEGEGGDDSIGGGSDTDYVGIAIWIVGALIIVSLLAFLLVVINGSEEEEEPAWGQEGYEDTISATYGAVAAAPTIGASGAVIEAQKPLPEIPPPAGPAPVPSLSPVSESAPEPAPAPVADAGPAIPDGGLPEGWTTDQWQHYGQQWLDNQQ